MWSGGARPIFAKTSWPRCHQACCRCLCHHTGWRDYRRFLYVVSPRPKPRRSSVAKKLPRSPNVPATLLGRLAVSIDFRGRGIGELLLLDAFKRVLANTQEVGSAVLVVDAKDERAREFYLRHDFIPLPSQPNRFFYTVKTIEKLFESKQGRKRD